MRRRHHWLQPGLFRQLLLRRQYTALHCGVPGRDRPLLLCTDIPADVDQLAWNADCTAFSTDLLGYETIFNKEVPSDWWKYLLISLGICAGLSLLAFLALIAIKLSLSNSETEFEGIPD